MEDQPFFYYRFIVYLPVSKLHGMHLLFFGKKEVTAFASGQKIFFINTYCQVTPAQKKGNGRFNRINIESSGNFRSSIF
jgi:hypothetical protein